MKVLNFGSCNVDYVYSLDHIVNKGETETTDKLEVFPGGKGLNQSIAVAKAGTKVYHAGCIGSGGEILTEILGENNVDTSFIKYVDEKNGHAIIQVSKEGENSIFLYPGSNEMISKEHIDEVFESFSEGDIVLLQNEINNLVYIIDRAHQKKMQIILNPSPYNEKIQDIDFNMITYLIVNEVEAKCISGCDEIDDILDYFRNKYPELKLMLTLGKAGCVYQENDMDIYHPIYKVKAVDTTAAGDTFTGYFVSGLTSSMDKKEILRLASCASAISVSRKGAAPSIPDMQEVLKQLEILQPEDKEYKVKDKYSVICEYVAGHLDDASLKELSEILGYSTAYTGRLVKKITGMSFNAFLQEKRLEMSARLLLKTELPVNEIITKTGYENQSFFRKLFKEKYGVNPLAYRKIQK